MAIGVGQTTKGQTINTSTSTAGINTAASGSTFVVAVITDAIFQSIYDTINGAASGNNSWTLIGAPVQGYASYNHRLYYHANANGGTNHVFTATTTTNSRIVVLALEITGAATASFDQYAGPVYDLSSPFSSGATPTTTQANELLVGLMGSTDSGNNPMAHAASGATPSTGWVIQSGTEYINGAAELTCGLATNIVSATGPYTWSYVETGGTVNVGTAAIATFKEAATGLTVPLTGLSPATLTIGTVTPAQQTWPASDIGSPGGWTSTGANLFGVIDEAVIDDNDYVTSVNPAADVFEVKFGALTDPASSSGHVVRYRIGATGGTCNFTVSFRQGASELTSWTHNGVGALTTVENTLTGPVTDAITDYGDLRLRFTATKV